MFHASFRSVRPRHPLARLLSGVLGIAALLMLVTLGMFAFAALVIGGALFLLLNAFRSARPPRAQAGAPTATPGVIEGEFTVVRDAASARAPASSRR